MVIKSETMDMEEFQETAATTNDTVNGNHNNNTFPTPPPSKRPRHDPPHHSNQGGNHSNQGGNHSNQGGNQSNHQSKPDNSPASNSRTDTSNNLQETLSAVIGNLGNLKPEQLQTLAGMLSTLSSGINLANGNIRTWTCDRCPSTFYSESDYYKHITFSHETDCGICLKSFDNHAELETHVHLEHQTTSSRNSSQSMICSICKLKFSNSSALNAHMISHTQVFKCDICDERFAEHRQLETHLSVFHEMHKPHSCHMCTESFATPSQLYKHISFKHDLDCSVCQVPFNNAADLKKHMSEEHLLECCACDKAGNRKVFNSVEAYDIHLTHFHKGVKFYKCINCKKRFMSLAEFQSHVMEAHQAESSTMVSPTKSKSSPNNKGLEKITVQESSEIPTTPTSTSHAPPSTPSTVVKCRWCSEQFTKTEILVKHVQQCHKGVCVYCNVSVLGEDVTEHVDNTHQRECELCDLVFRAEYRLLEHYQECHNELTPTKCVQCDKRYISASGLLEHMTTRHPALSLPPLIKSEILETKEDSVYNCKQCHYKAGGVVDLKKHNQAAHNTTCNTCNKVFLNTTMLDLHNLTEHQITCHFCSSSTSPFFSSKEFLIKHKLAEHPEKCLHPCWLCNEPFETGIQLALHVAEHLDTKKGSDIVSSNTVLPNQYGVNKDKVNEHDKPFFSCDICTHCFVSESALHKHIEIYHENIVFFNCNKCPKKTLSKPELDRHIVAFHKDDYEYTTCDICNEKFTNQSDYFKHVSFAHDETSSQDDSSNKCLNCSASFTTEVSFIEHQVKCHQKNKLFVCKTCGVKFTSYYRLGRHIKIVHKGTEFSCDICNKSFQSTTALYRHQKTYHENELGVKICLTCGARLPDQASLQEHTKHHFNVPDLRCKQCNMTFDTLGALNDHNIYHQRQEYRCIDCGKTYSSQADLKVHVSVEHGGMIMCKVCEDVFPDEVVLQNHVKLQHAGSNINSKSYRCTDCGETFSHSSELKVHVTLKHLGRTITGDGTPKYNCVDCSESFTDKQALKAHIGSQHTGNMVCNKCCCVFATQNELTEHTCSSSSYNSLQCKQCKAQFNLISQLEEHMLTHISINVNEQYCTQCNKQFHSIKELESHECKGKAETGSHDYNNARNSNQTSTSDFEALVNSLTKQQVAETPNHSSAKPSNKCEVKIEKTNTPTPYIPNILSSLLGPTLNTSPEALSEALSELSASKISELISTLTSNQDVIKSLVTNPPKLPDSLKAASGRVSPVGSCLRSSSPKVEPIFCPKCKNKFFAKQALASHLQTCAPPVPVQRLSVKPDTSNTAHSPKSQNIIPNTKPDLKLVHRQLFIAAQNTDVSILNIQQVETLIQVLASEDGLKKVPQHRVVDLLDAIEKSVKLKEAKQKEARKQRTALRKLTSSPSISTKSPPRKGASPVHRGTPSPSFGLNSQSSSPMKPTKPGKVYSVSSPKEHPSLTDCLPPEITAAILPAIKEDKTDMKLLAEICSCIKNCKVALPDWLTNELTLALTRAIQILKHPDATNKSTLNELKSIIITILGNSGSSEKSIRQGTMNVLKRNYKIPVLQESNTSFSDLDMFVQFLLSNILPSLKNDTSHLLTLPFVLDLVLKNKNS